MLLSSVAATVSVLLASAIVMDVRTAWMAAMRMLAVGYHLRHDICKYLVVSTGINSFV